MLPPFLLLLISILSCLKEIDGYTEKCPGNRDVPYAYHTETEFGDVPMRLPKESIGVFSFYRNNRKGYFVVMAPMLSTASFEGSGDAGRGADEPEFVQSSQVFRAVSQEAVTLPCEVINAGNFVLVWKRGVAVLTAGSVKVTPDERISLVRGYDLHITDITPQDAGTYTCQIGTLTPKELSHTVEVLVPPRIHHVTAGGKIEVRWGDTVSLECHASGNPAPKVQWSRKNNLLPSGEQSREGSMLTMERTTRHQAGTYLCTANNGVGEPAVQSISLHVLYQPEVEVERSWVHSGEGFEAQLVCIVHADPPADVLWYRSTLRVDSTERHIMEARGNRHTLIIREVKADDFGNYTCVADNSIGKTRQTITLSGEPGAVIFKSDPVSRYKDAYNLTWSVNSYTPIVEYKLYLRKAADEHSDHVKAYQNAWGKERLNAWRDMVLPAIPSELFSQHMSYLIRSLEPSSQYEIRVQARNRFGWNEPSEVFQFSTRALEIELNEISRSVVRGGVSSGPLADLTLMTVAFVMALARLS